METKDGHVWMTVTSNVCDPPNKHTHTKQTK